MSKTEPTDPAALADRLDELRQWSASRIRHCRELELKFGTRIGKRGPAQSLVEAWTERRSLQAVRRILWPELEDT